MSRSAVTSSSRLSRRARELQEAPISWLMNKALQVPGLLSLAAGFVDQETLPHGEVGRLASQLLGDPESGRRALQYGTTAGESRLRRQVLRRLSESFEAPIWKSLDEDDVVLTGGSQQLLYLLGELLLDDGDIVLVENPSYFVYVGALQSLGARLVGLRVDAHGLIPSSLEQTLERLDSRQELDRVKMLYTMPYYQNPTGATLSADRRLEISNLLEHWQDRGLDAIVLEDAAYRGLRFPGVDDLQPLFEHQSENHRVCYIDSFSKTLSPGLRVGYGVLPRGIREALLRLKSHHDFGSCHLSQQLVLRVIESGLFESHGLELRHRYQAKCSRLHDLLAGELPGLVDFVVPQGGLYLWMTLRGEVDTGMTSALFAGALEERVIYVPGEICGRPGDDGGETLTRSMRLCFAYPTDDEVQEAGLRLARSIRGVLG